MAKDISKLIAKIRARKKPDTTLPNFRALANLTPSESGPAISLDDLTTNIPSKLEAELANRRNWQAMQKGK